MSTIDLDAVLKIISEVEGEAGEEFYDAPQVKGGALGMLARAARQIADLPEAKRNEHPWMLTAEERPENGVQYEFRLNPIEKSGGVWRGTYRAESNQFLVDVVAGFRGGRFDLSRVAAFRRLPEVANEPSAGASFSDLAPEQHRRQFDRADKADARVEELTAEMVRLNDAVRATEASRVHHFARAEDLTSQLADMRRRAEVAEKALADYRAEDAAAQNQESYTGGPLRLTRGRKFAVISHGDGDAVIVPEVDDEEWQWLERLVHAYNLLHGHDDEEDARVSEVLGGVAERCPMRAAERAARRCCGFLEEYGLQLVDDMRDIIAAEYRRMYDQDAAPTAEQVESPWPMPAGWRDETAPVVPLADAQKAIIREIARCGAEHPTAWADSNGSPVRCTLGNGHEGPHVAEPEDGGTPTAWRRGGDAVRDETIAKAQCSRARSDMTPCVIEGVTGARFAWDSKGRCIGCGRSAVQIRGDGEKPSDPAAECEVAP